MIRIPLSEFRKFVDYKQLARTIYSSSKKKNLRHPGDKPEGSLTKDMVNLVHKYTALQLKLVEFEAAANIEGDYYEHVSFQNVRGPVVEKMEGLLKGNPNAYKTIDSIISGEINRFDLEAANDRIQKLRNNNSVEVLTKLELEQNDFAYEDNNNGYKLFGHPELLLIASNRYTPLRVRTSKNQAAELGVRLQAAALNLVMGSKESTDTLREITGKENIKITEYSMLSDSQGIEHKIYPSQYKKALPRHIGRFIEWKRKAGKLVYC